MNYYPTLKQSELTENAQILLCKRYYSKLGDNPICELCGQAHETHDEFLTRVAGPIDSIYRKQIEGGKFLPNSPTLFNRGLDNGTLSACFVLEIQDNMLDDDGIMDVGRDAAAITKYGGGVGYYFGNLRPKGTPVNSTHGKACGPVEVMRYLHAVGRMITQSGKRAAAQMGVMPVEHLDILEFITCKNENPDDLSTFNISVSVPDSFMKLVESGDDYANYLFDNITQSAWNTGDPGLIFRDRVNRDNPTPEDGPILACNPCCLTGDTWIMTTIGPRQIKDLIGKRFQARLNGKGYYSTPAGFFSKGVGKVYQLNTKEGYTLKLTPEHKIMTPEGWVKAQDLQAGSKIVINNHRNHLYWPGLYTEEQGYVMGSLVGDGYINKDKGVLAFWPGVEDANGEVRSPGAFASMARAMEICQSMDTGHIFKGEFQHVPTRGQYSIALKSLGSLATELGIFAREKCISPTMEKASSQFAIGFLRGFFDADGSVQGDAKHSISVRLGQADLGRLEGVQRMLLRLGIASTIYKNRKLAGESYLPDGKGGYKYYPTKAMHEIVISRENVVRFRDVVGFVDSDKSNKLDYLISEYSRNFATEDFLATVVSVEDTGCEEEVYDCTIEDDVHAFDANGIYVSNSEQMLKNNESCNLASLNLMAFYDVETGEFDWDELRFTVAIMMRYLNDILDENIWPTEGIEDASMYVRRIGIGFMGLSDLLALKQVDYDTDEAREFAAEISRVIKEQSEVTNRYLAERDGQAPCYEGTGIMKRNGVVRSIQPTGTTALLLGISTGIEPLFALQNTRQTADGDTLYEHPLSVDILRNQGIDYTPKVAEDIAPIDHIKMVSAVQPFIDNGISKTVNLPNSATVNDVREIMLEAWRQDCKAVSIFRDGCRDKQVLSKCGDDVCTLGEIPEELQSKYIIEGTE